MGVVEEGFFNQRIDDDWKWVRILNITVTASMLMVQCTIGAVTYFKMPRNIDWKLKAVFMMAIMFSCIAMIVMIVMHTMLLMSFSVHRLVALYIYIACLDYFFESLLVTFVLRFVFYQISSFFVLCRSKNQINFDVCSMSVRLHLTFKNSVYRMSTCT